MSKLYIHQIDDDLQRRMGDALQFIDWEKIVKPGASVFIKPNLTWPDPLPGVTTDPRFIDALLGHLRHRAGRLYVGESNGGTFAAEEGFNKHGLPEVCRKHGAELVNLSKKPAAMIHDVINGRSIEIEVSKFLLDEVDVFITMPVLKTHVVTRVTLGLKNQWGCIPTNMRLLYHHILDWGIVALNRAYAPQIIVLDGTYAMDKRGPLEGEAVPAGWFAVSDDIVALDSVGCHLLGVEARSVRHIRFAEQEGLGMADLRQIQSNQPLPPPIIQSVIEPNLMDKIAIFLYKRKNFSKLVFDSPLTGLLYKVIGRTPPGTLLGYQPEDAYSTGD